MASIKVKLRLSTNTDLEGTIYYQIIHERKVRQLLTDYKVYPSEWNESRSMINVPNHGERMLSILSIRECIRWDVDRLNRIIKKLDLKGIPYTVGDIIEEFVCYVNEYTVCNFMERVIINLRQKEKVRTSETYQSTLNSFMKFRRNEDLMFDCLTPEIMESYEGWLRQRGVTPNTISFYIRILRAAYNRLVKRDVIDNRNPFRNVYTGVGKTIKRALPLSAIKKIKELDLSFNPTLEFARDMFLMSFYLRGMSFIDMAFLKKSDLKDGRVTYRRRKTGQLLMVGWTPEMQMIIDKYPENMTCYLLPIITTNGPNEEYNRYRKISCKINYNLKKISKIIGINTSLTLYVARHSWASVAKAKGIPLGVISEGMGHNSETTTRIYLASLDASVVDRANSVILSSLK